MWNEHVNLHPLSEKGLSVGFLITVVLLIEETGKHRARSFNNLCPATSNTGTAHLSCTPRCLISSITKARGQSVDLSRDTKAPSIMTPGLTPPEHSDIKN